MKKIVPWLMIAGGAFLVYRVIVVWQTNTDKSPLVPYGIGGAALVFFGWKLKNK